MTYRGGLAPSHSASWGIGSWAPILAETATQLPHVFTIRVKQMGPLKVKCLHQTMSVLAR